MAAKRKLDTLTEVPGDMSGNTYATQVQESMEALWKLNGGELTSIAGTADAITATLAVGTGFAAITPGFAFSFRAASTCIGTTTITIDGQTVTLCRKDGSNLQANDFLEDEVLLCVYNSVIDKAVITNLNVIDIAASQAYVFSREYLSTATWTAPYDCVVRVWVFGGGGSGGASTGSSPGASGGAAGGSAVKQLTVLSGDTIVINSIGAGGVGVTRPSNGNAGGLTKVTFADASIMQATGGAGGLYGDSTTVLGVVGGIGSGGDYNFTGGSTASTAYGGTGGGAVGIWDDGIASTGSHGAGFHSTDATLAGRLLTTVAPFALIGLKGTIGASSADTDDADNFCGSGGLISSGTNHSGDGGLGGGGSGGVTTLNAAVVSSGDGGQGFVSIEWSAVLA